MEASLHCYLLDALHFELSMLLNWNAGCVFSSLCFVLVLGVWVFLLLFFGIVPSCCVFSLQHSSLGLEESLCWLL